MDLREIPQGEFVRHPWELARAQFFCGLLCEHVAAGEAVRILDVGAGDGYLARCALKRLPAGSSICCVDINYTQTELERRNAEAPPGLSFAREPLGGSFDWLMLLDVLEHIEDDLGSLRALVAGALRAGGRALISVPAWPALYVRHDVALGHHRRYRPEHLTTLVTASGLSIEERGGLYSSLLVMRALEKLLERARSIDSRPANGQAADTISTDLGEWRLGPLVTNAVKGLLVLDQTLGRALGRSNLQLPGLSVWTLARKPVLR
jgi:2-polyprenyl-3-methyl-5-hydroxy-6-metoxy-1,4-benzoquinol methylase